MVEPDFQARHAEAIELANLFFGLGSMASDLGVLCAALVVVFSSASMNLTQEAFENTLEIFVKAARADRLSQTEPVGKPN